MSKTKTFALSLTVEAVGPVGSYSIFKPVQLVAHRIHVNPLYSNVKKDMLVQLLQLLAPTTTSRYSNWNEGGFGEVWSSIRNC